LVQYVPETLVRKKSSLKRVTGQRVLTSAEGLALLKKKRERERRRQKIYQEIEQR